MIILLNGAIGAGKTSVAQHLLESHERAAIIDGELITAVRPFNYRNVEDWDHACKTLRLVLDRHTLRGIDTYFVTWILETPKQVSHLLAILSQGLCHEMRVFLLLCEDNELVERIRRRRRPNIDREIERSRELSRIFREDAHLLELGCPIDTTQICAKEVARTICVALSEDQSTNHH